MSTNYPQISVIFNRRKTASLKTKASVEIRICHNYKQKFISTGIRLYSHQWKDGKIINCPDIMEISQTLDKMLSDIRHIIMEMLDKNQLDISIIPSILIRRNNECLDFLDFCKQRAEIRKYRKALDSQERYDRFLKLFSKWGKIRDFDDVNEKSIISYDKYLTSIGMKPYSKWNNYHRFLNSFILDAIDAGYIKKNPYKWVNIEKNKSITGIGKYLTLEEFKRLKETKMPTLSLERVRDVFIFQTYTCMSYTDLRNFDTEKIQEIKGMKVYTGNRHKTNKPFTIPILPQAWDVIIKYEKHLPIISNAKYNIYLKAVAQYAEIDKPISSHWARHTGATLLLNEGISMHIISKICGHSSTKITEQIYAKLLDESVIDAVHKINI